MLLTQRWRGDPTEASVDPDRDGNAFSFYFHSRLDIGLPDGERFVCEELRDGCPGLTSNDGWRGVRPIRHRPIVLVRVYVDRRLVLTRRGRALHSVRVPVLAGSGRHRIRVLMSTRRGRTRTVRRTVYGCARRAVR